MIDITPDYIHQSNLIEGYDDPAYDKQSMVAWKYLRKQKELTHEVICELQRLITASQDDLEPHLMGAYRPYDVQIGSYTPIHHSYVKGYMDNWLLDYKAQDPKVAHIAYETIHPFADGNGRSGRMLMWWQEIQNGQEPTLILNITKHADYYSWFKR